MNWADERVAREGCGPLDIARVLEFPAFVTSAAAPETGGSEPYCPALASAMPAVEEEGEEEEEPAGENAFECEFRPKGSGCVVFQHAVCSQFRQVHADCRVKQGSNMFASSSFIE